MFSGILKYTLCLFLSCGTAGFFVSVLSDNPANSADAALASRLAILRAAIDHYRVQHPTYPGESGDGDIVDHLFGSSDRQGMIGSGPRHPYGPYLRGDEPAHLPFNPLVASHTLKVVSTMPPRADGRSAWIYCPKTGDIRANTIRSVHGTNHFQL